MHRFVLPGLVAAFVLAGAAHAQPQSRPGGPPSESGPRRLFLSPSGEPFRGGDGLAAWFKGADADKDGTLTLPEFRADALRFFKVLDADADGAVGSPENSAYEQRIAPEITQMFVPGEGGRRPVIARTKRTEPRQGAARFSLLNEAQPVRGADFDLNQKVSAEEWAKAAGRRFGLLDADGDGKLTIETLAPRLP